MKRLLILIAIFSINLCVQGTYVVQRATWKEFIESSDFIVYARPTKIEEIGDKKYKTTFTIERIYTGSAPKELSFEWVYSDWHITYEHYFSMNDLSDHYLLFMQNEGDTYSLFEERFILKRKEVDGWRGLYGNYVCLDFFDLKSFPPELAEKIVDKVKVVDDKFPTTNDSSRYIKWDDIKAWLDSKYPLPTKESANQGMDLTR